MNHPNYTELQHYCDGALPEPALLSVRSHLDACPACSAVVMQEQAMLRALQRSPYTVPGPDFEQRVLSQLSGQGVGVATDQRWLSRYAALFFGMATTLAVVLLSTLTGGGATDAQPSRLETVTKLLKPLLDAIPLPSLRIGDPLSSTHGEAIQIFAAALGVLMILATLDRFVLQPLIKPRSRGSRGIASGSRGQ